MTSKYLSHIEGVVCIEIDDIDRTLRCHGSNLLCDNIVWRLHGFLSCCNHVIQTGESKLISLPFNQINYSLKLNESSIASGCILHLVYQ